MSRTDELLAFLEETEKLREVYRQIWLPGPGRQESDAEHSWHLALMLLLFEKELPPGFDLLKAVKMALLHDIVEIDAGDAFAFDPEARKGKAEREEKAAQRIFGMLPPDLRDEFLAIFHEFEEAKSVEANYVRSFDILQPGFMNLFSEGEAWKRHGISVEQAHAYAREKMAHSPLTKGLYDRLIAEAMERKLLKE